MRRHGPALGHSSSLNSHYLPVAFHLGMGSYVITPILVAISAGVTVQVLFRWPYCWVQQSTGDSHSRHPGLLALTILPLTLL